MSVFKAIWRCIILVGFVGVLTLSATAEDVHVSVMDRTCTLAGGANLSVYNVLNRRFDFDCSSNRFEKATDHLWLYADVADMDISSVANYVILHTSRQNDITIYTQYTDGSFAKQRYTPKDQAQLWHAFDSTAIPLPVRGEASLSALLISIDHPWDPANWGQIELVNHTSMDGHVLQLVLAGVFCGLLVVPLVLNLVFIFVLRKRFVIIHSALILCVMVYAISWSGFIFPILPFLDMLQRSTLNHIVITLALLAACFLTYELCEEHTLSKIWRYILIIAGCLPLLVNLIMMIAAPRFPHYGSQLIHAVAMLPIFAITAALIAARRRGSHMALIQLFGWSLQSNCRLGCRNLQSFWYRLPRWKHEVVFYPSVQTNL